MAELCCTICLDTFSNPKVLACGHSFCAGCLQDVCSQRPQGTSTFHCPDCRAIFQIPPNGIADLPTNFAIIRAIATPKPNRDRSNSSTSNSPIPKSLSQVGKKHLPFLTKCVTRCLKQEMLKSKKWYDLLANLLGSWEQTLEMKSREIVSAREHLIKQKEIIIKAAEESFTKEIVHLMHKQIIERQNDELEMDKIQQSLSKLKELQVSTETFLQDSPPEDVITMADTYLASISNYPDYNSLQYPKNKEMSLVVASEVTLKRQIGAMFKLTETTRTIIPTPIFVTEFPANATNATSATIYDILLLENGDLVLSDSTIKSNKVMNTEGVCLQTMPVLTFGQWIPRLCPIPSAPDCILAIDYDPIRATLKKWNLTTNTVTPFMKTALNSAVRQSYGITVTQYDSKPVIAVSIGYSCEICIISKDGDEITKVILDFGKCRFMAGHSEQPFIVVNHDYDKIAAYNINAQSPNYLLWVRSKDKGDIPGAAGMAMDHLGNTFVCCSRDGKIRLFNPDGLLLSIHVMDGLKDPHGVAYDSQRHTLAVVGKSGLVKLFAL